MKADARWINPSSGGTPQAGAVLTHSEANGCAAVPVALLEGSAPVEFLRERIAPQDFTHAGMPSVPSFLVIREMRLAQVIDDLAQAVSFHGLSTSPGIRGASESAFGREGERRWTESDLRQLARSSPAQLNALLRPRRLEPAVLTYAAEAASCVENPSLDLIDALVALLSHPKAYVREGAVYGLQPHLTDELAARLERIASRDRSPAFRKVVQDVLETYRDP